MEELLNKLIEKGWKPRGLKHKIFSVQRTPDNMVYFDGGFGLERCYDFRQLTSKESGLWQFVCEKELVYRIWHDEKTYKKRKNDDGETKFAYSSDYWIIQSSLCDEDKLEQFLLENIKV